MYRGAIVQQVSEEEERYLRKICEKEGIQYDKFIVALIRSLKEEEINLVEDEEGWKVIPQNSSKESGSLGLVELGLSKLSDIYPTEESEDHSNWRITYQTNRESGEIPNSLLDLVNVLGLAEKLDIGVDPYLLRQKLGENDGDYDDELDVATDELYEVAENILNQSV